MTLDEKKRAASERMSVWYRANKAHAQAYHRNRAEANPARRMVYDAKKRAKNKGLPFALVEADICIPNFCPVLGIPLSIGKGGCHDGSPTIDRRDNSLGYVPSNIVIVSSRANRIKNDASTDELRAILRFYEMLT